MAKLGGVKRLSLVGKQQDSAASQSAPNPNAEALKARNEDIKARQAAGLAKAQEARREAGARARAAREAGERSPLDRYRAGEYPCVDWEDDEVNAGRPRNLDGTFGGKYPNFTGRQHAEIKRELLKRGQRKIDGVYSVAIDALVQIAQYGESEAARVKAAQLLAERSAGKVPEKIELKSSDPWQDILDEIMDDEVLNRMSTNDGAAHE